MSKASQDFAEIATAMREAGWDVGFIDFTIGDITVDAGREVLNFTVQPDGMVTWDDFTHCTRLAKLDDKPGLIAAFRELLPLRDARLQEWIKGRQYR